MFDNRASEADQLAAIKDITGGRFSRVVDASAQAAELSLKALETSTMEGKKYFTTVNDWLVFSALILSMALTQTNLQTGPPWRRLLRSLCTPCIWAFSAGWGSRRGGRSPL